MQVQLSRFLAKWPGHKLYHNAASKEKWKFHPVEFMRTPRRETWSHVACNKEEKGIWTYLKKLLKSQVIHPKWSFCSPCFKEYIAFWNRATVSCSYRGERFQWWGYIKHCLILCRDKLSLPCWSALESNEHFPGKYLSHNLETCKLELFSKITKESLNAQLVFLHSFFPVSVLI